MEVPSMGATLGHSRTAGIAVGALVVVLALTAGGFAATPRPPRWVLHGKYAPAIDPANFVAKVDNRYLPLRPGTTFHFRGVKDSTRQVDDVLVMHRIKRVLGIRCTIVRDTVFEHGTAVERTFDWYAQDNHGNVWYMGEDSLERKNGRLVRASDSWQAGVNGAKPGIIMRGRPRAGDVYRQEYYPPGGALDQARIVGLTGPVRVPAGSFRRVLVTIEWSPVEPQLEKKFYVAGIGEVKEAVVQGGHEQFALAKVTRTR
jgi:hypothetical protein